MVEYDVNLEIMKSLDSEGKDNRLSSEYVAIEFNGGEKKLLNSLDPSTPTYKKEATETEAAMEAVEGRYLVSGSLNGKESKSYTIKLWMDESVEIEDDAMNKNFISKIVVTANQSHVVRLADLVQMGDYVEMIPTSTSYTIPTSMTGYSIDQTINPSELNLWRVIKINEDGTIDMVSEYASSTEVKITGATGYSKFVQTLQTVAEQYKNDEYTIATRHTGYNGQTYQVSSSYKCPNWISWASSTTNSLYESSGCGDMLYEQDFNLLSNLNLIDAKVYGQSAKAAYWFSSRGYVADHQFANRVVLRVSGSSTIWFENSNMVLYGDYFVATNSPVVGTMGARIRPIITIKVVTNVIGSGSIDNPYKLS